MSIYDIKVTKRENRQDIEVSMEDYKGKVLLIVNTATKCGLTPQYEALEKLYRKYKDAGFCILDFPCNQFMEQAKGDDEEIESFCTAKYDTTFPRFKKIEVNGANEIPLYKWLKKQKGFAGFDKGHKLTPILEGMFDKNNPGWRSTSDIKWNFTKFLINKKGKVVARLEPTATMAEMMPVIQAELTK